MQKKEGFSACLQKHKSKILSAAGTLLLGVAAICLESSIAAGFLSIAGLLLLFFGGRYAESRRDIILNAILLWLGYCLRFLGSFDGEIYYTLLFCVAFIPYCAVLTGALFLDRFLRKSGHSLLSSLAVPFVYALSSYLLVICNIGNIFNLIEYLISIPVIGINTSLICEYSLTFILLWILMAIPSVFTEPAKRNKILLGAVSILLSAALLTSGTVLRGQWDEPDYTLNVALATTFKSSFIGEGDTYSREEQLEMFKKAMAQASEQDAKLLVLNEEYFFWKEENADEMLDSVSQVVSEYGIPTLIGVYIFREDDYALNEAIYFDAAGQIQYTYIKHNLIPLIETLDCESGPAEPAVIHTTVDGHELDLAFIICYDINDETYLRNIPDTVELLIVPSWDWNTVNLEQKRTAIRSATLGLTLLKHSYDSFSHVSCPNGDITEIIDFRGQYETVKTVTVPIWER